MSVKQSNGEVIQVPFKDPVRQQGSLITDKLENLQEGQCTLSMEITYKANSNCGIKNKKFGQTRH